jgi:hypothetical protein
MHERFEMLQATGVNLCGSRHLRSSKARLIVYRTINVPRYMGVESGMRCICSRAGTVQRAQKAGRGRGRGQSGKPPAVIGGIIDGIQNGR